ncbi:MAG: DNA-directed RNA polymerase [Conexivisphaera sp.]
MFQLVELEDVVRIPPQMLGMDLSKAAAEELSRKYSSTANPELGYIIRVVDVEVDPVGRIVHGDGAVYHKVRFRALVFYPKLQEVVEGEVVEITDFGAFVRIGPLDALLHISQVTDDYLTVDMRQGAIVGKGTGKMIKGGTRVRVRISVVSMGRGMRMDKIGVTSRQPFLGALEWIDEEIKKARQPAQAKAKQG